MDREQQVLTLLRRRGETSVSQLSSELGVSIPTIRRDLRRLAEADLIIRTHGGAVVRTAAPTGGSASTRADDPLIDRIGRATADLIGDGETIGISSGATTLAVARHLTARSELTVITNALDIAQVMLDQPGIELIVLGGEARPGMHSLLGHLTEMTIKELRADRVVMGIAAFDPRQGLTNDYMPEVLIDRALAGIAGNVTVVADSSKYGRVEPAHVFHMSEIDTLVTDSGLSDEGFEAIAERGVEVIRV